MTRIAIVTGSGQGIGEGIARQLVNDGLTVAVADMNEENARSVAEDIGNNSKGYYVDVSDKKSVFDLVDHVIDDFGKLDVFSVNMKVKVIQSKRIVNPFLLKFWIFCTSIKEVFVCTTKIHKCNLGAAFTNFTYKRKFIFLDGIECLVKFKTSWLFAILILPFPFC